MNPVSDRLRTDDWPPQEAGKRIVATLQCAAFWTAIALTILYVPLLGAWQDAVTLEMFFGLVGVHGGLFLVGHGYHDSPAMTEQPADHPAAMVDGNCGE